jgi:endo-beta-N-acetylglucosaminidase D
MATRKRKKTSQSKKVRKVTRQQRREKTSKSGKSKATKIASVPVEERLPKGENEEDTRIKRNRKPWRSRKVLEEQARETESHQKFTNSNWLNSKQKEHSHQEPTFQNHLIFSNLS